MREDEGGTDTPREQEVTIAPTGLQASLVPPTDGNGLVIFAHGSGSSRHSPRNRHVAARLQEAGLGTLLFDLLDDDEAQDLRKVFDIPLLADRLVQVTAWVRGQPSLRDAPLGYFGASTGAAAALVAETRTPQAIGAIVSRGGRPDLAGPALPHVRAPTLLIVGSDDTEVVELNEVAAERLGCETEIAIVPGAGHLFEEPGMLDSVVDLARGWFSGHLKEP